MANLTRAKPVAYLIPLAWTDLVTRLVDSGVEVTRLPYAFKGPVEALTIVNAELESSYYEGVVRVALTTETVEKTISLPVGAYWISTAQKNAALAFVALEVSSISETLY